MKGKGFNPGQAVVATQRVSVARMHVAAGFNISSTPPLSPRPHRLLVYTQEQLQQSESPTVPHFPGPRSLSSLVLGSLSGEGTCGSRQAAGNSELRWVGGGKRGTRWATNPAFQSAGSD